ncbi:MAG TPA: 30S ribosomal protein S19e [Candidatus Thermoplasmatota archaeon]
MTTVFDVPADRIIEAAAQQLKGMKEIQPPEWAAFAKTGVHREKPPVRKDWWHIRTAAILRKVYLNGPIGTERLAANFGGNADNGSAPKHARKSSRSVVRKSLQQLRAAGLVTSEPKARGATVTPKGQSFLDNVAHEVMKELAAKRPELSKYY